MKILKLLFLCVLTLTTTAHAQTVRMDPERTITISGIVDATVLQKANELLSMAETSKKPIDVLIASPGGVISYGLYFIQAMKVAQVKGVIIRCYVPELAASMAFTIFTQCNEKYALPYSRLLFHAPRIGGNFMLTPPIAVGLAKGLLQIEDVLLKLLIPAMGITRDKGGDWFVDSYQEERLFIGQDLYNESPVKWFTVVKKIDGCPDLFPNPWPKTSGPDGQGRAIYIYQMPEQD